MMIAYCSECGVSTSSDADLIAGALDEFRVVCENFCPCCGEPWNWLIAPEDEFYLVVLPRFAELARTGDCEHVWRRVATSENSPSIGQYICNRCEEVVIGVVRDGVLHELPAPIAGLVLNHKTGVWSKPKGGHNARP